MSALFWECTPLRLNPNYSAAYFQHGQAHQEKGRFDLAISDYDAALRLNPNYTKAKTAREVAKQRGIGHSNAVGSFLMAKSPYGGEEMSGNVC